MIKGSLSGIKSQTLDRMVIGKEVLALKSKIENIDRKKLEYPLVGSVNFRGNSGLELKASILGFCGKLYPVVQIKQSYPLPDLVKSYYSLEDFKNSVYGQSIDWNKKKKRTWGFRWFSYGFLDVEDLDTFFSQDLSKLSNLFSKYNCPVFLYGQWNQKYEVRLNPTLKDLEFFKVQNPFTCFQELSMYIGGVLKQPDRPMVEITDKDRISKHGFDKYSFRKLPQPKK